MRRGFAALLAALALLAPVAVSQAAAAAAQPAAAQLEKAITEAAERFERGEIKGGAPFTVRLGDGRTVSFSLETFEADVDRAFELLDALLRQQRAGVPAAAKAGVAPAGGAPDAPAAKDSRLDALMRAEQKTSAAASAPGAVPPPEYSVYGNYRQSREARIDAEDRAAEADMQQVIAERQAAEADRARKLERDQAVQLQSMKWQDELDRQASASAKAAAAWQAEHSPAAYAKSFLGTVIQTAVGAFTGGFLGVVSNNLANKAVRSLYRDGEDVPPPLPPGPPGAPGTGPGYHRSTGTPGASAPPAKPANPSDTTRIVLKY